MAFLSSIVASILDIGLGKARKEILKKQLVKNGGTFVETVDSGRQGVTHVLVGDSVTFERACRSLKTGDGPASSNLRILRADWLSCCLKSSSLVDHAPFLVNPPPSDDGNSDSDGSKTNHPGSDQKSSSDVADNAPEPVKTFGEATYALSTVAGGVSSTNTSACSSTTASPVKGAAPERAPITATVVGSGYAGRKRKSEHVKWLAPGSQSDGSGDETDSLDSEDDNLSQMALQHHRSKTAGLKKKVSKYMCDQPSTESVNHNKHITEKLQELMKIHEINRDQFRVLGYRKAITALRGHPKPVETREEVEAINGIGKRIADKVVEVIESGGLRRLNHVDPKIEVVQLFMGIWGAGPETAKKWYSEGFRTLDDIRQKATLNRQQLVGLRLYDDLNKRMPRPEVAEIEATVKQAALSIIPELEMMTCGSYRRGKATCGDVDILITHPDGRSHHSIFKPLLAKLHETGFLTDDLVSHEFNGDQQKYFGVCRLGPDRLHRRLDIITVPYKELPCALLYFTGSGLFNRSMRCKARHMGMSLSEHALRTGVVRRGNDKIVEGVALPVSCEKDVFDHLGMDFLEPHERER